MIIYTDSEDIPFDEISGLIAIQLLDRNQVTELPNITLGNLRIQIYRTKNILILFEKKGIGIDRIKLVIYSVSDISRLINTQIQNIID